MVIDYKGDTPVYYDVNGERIENGDTVLLNGREERVYLTEDNELGVDATNPAWIERGWACECEFGIYPFCEDDEPILIKKGGK